MTYYVLLDQSIGQRYTEGQLYTSHSSRSWGDKLGNKAINEPWNQFFWLHSDSICSALALTLGGRWEACRHPVLRPGPSARSQPLRVSADR